MKIVLGMTKEWTTLERRKLKTVAVSYTHLTLPTTERV